MLSSVTLCVGGLFVGMWLCDVIVGGIDPDRALDGHVDGFIGLLFLLVTAALL